MAPTTGDTYIDTGCACLLGRRDLAFISKGYQVKTLSMPNSATPDNSTLDPNSLFANINDTSQQVPVVDPQSVPSADPQVTMNQVDVFLWNLYSTLDNVHQQYENILRGEPQMLDPNTAADLAESDAELSQDVRFGTQAGGAANLSPPFSPEGRGTLGDPTALAQQGSSALSDLTTRFQNFGAALRSST